MHLEKRTIDGKDVEVVVIAVGEIPDCIKKDSAKHWDDVIALSKFTTAIAAVLEGESK